MEDFPEYQGGQGGPFSLASNNFTLMLNVDWFQPFDRGNYTVGVIPMQ